MHNNTTHKSPALVWLMNTIPKLGELEELDRVTRPLSWRTRLFLSLFHFRSHVQLRSATYHNAESEDST